jgi:hypothetical protein
VVFWWGFCFSYSIQTSSSLKLSILSRANTKKTAAIPL